MNVLPIKAAPLVVRAGGARSHLDLPHFEADDVERWQNWLQEHCLEVMRVWMEDDARAVDSYMRFLAGDSAGALSAWQPCRPDGDQAWFLLAVFDGREGPCAYFARRVSDFSDGTDTKGVPFFDKDALMSVVANPSGTLR